jgi:ribosome-associated translation inhibitor RaiA
MKLPDLANKVSIFSLTLALTLAATGSSFAVTDARPATGAAQIKLDVCQRHESKILSRMDHVIKQLDKHLGVFEKLQKRVEARLEKVTKEGKTVPNQATLVIAMNDARARAEAAIAIAKGKTFSCTDTDPKADLAAFRDAVKDAKRALHNYRLAIKNLNVAISSVTGETERSATGSSKSRSTGQ